MTERLPLFRATVRPEWIDYNGHMSEAFYVLAFGHATDAMMIETGLGPGYREQSNCSLYTAEAHVRYLREVAEGSQLAIRTRVLGVDAKKVRFAHEMRVRPADGSGADAGDGAPVATIELLGIHVDQEAGHAAPLPDAVRERFDALTEAPPEWAGRAIGPVPRAQDEAHPQ
ncbi:thioesterase family protein [Streptomyces montanisoli]|uniref:Thioesterase family protein n=1 Tax=Streptomyces montanisoli TaxID=2798581 RepID=A0A940MB02_9ACTN|nr:thioesterase family protein [Streptomyces montanisoli]MBP0456342.1 thioesterase family protein [Streptomyces montanisoli]